MQPRRHLIIVIMSGGIGLGCMFLTGGCGDDSKTTGTQVQISPEVKAQLNDMKASQKEQMAERRAARKKKS